MRSIRRERSPRDYKDTARLTLTPLNNVVFLEETLRKACLLWLIAIFFCLNDAFTLVCVMSKQINKQPLNGTRH